MLHVTIVLHIIVHVTKSVKYGGNFRRIEHLHITQGY